jgi:hypothetical protein
VTDLAKWFEQIIEDNQKGVQQKTKAESRNPGSVIPM